MPRSTRQILIDYAFQALDKLNLLDEILYNMEALSDGRQPAITEMSPVLLQGSEAVRQLWTILKDQL